MHGGVEIGPVAGNRGCGHPIGGEVDLAEVADLRGGEIGECFADRETRGRGGVVDRHGRALAHREGFAGVDIKRRGSHRAVGDGHLPRADHLVAADEAGDATVADGDEKRFVGDGRVREHAARGLEQGDAAEIEPVEGAREGRVGARHARRLAEENFKREIDGLVLEMRILDDELLGLGCFADDGAGAALACAELLEDSEAVGGHGEDVAFLRLVAPDFERRHARLVVRHLAQIEPAAEPGVVHQFRERVGETAGTDVVDERNGVGVAERPAAVDDFLAPALHLGVVALNAREIKVGVAGAAAEGAGGAAAEPDQHRGTAEDDEFVAGIDFPFLHMPRPDVADAAGDHDGLVVAAQLGRSRNRELRAKSCELRVVFLTRSSNLLARDCSRHFRLERAEITVDRGAAELVVECRAAERTFDHDVERRDDAAGFAVVLFPRPDGTGQAEIRDSETDEASFGFRAAAGRTFVANLAAGTGGGAGVGRDCRRMVVGFDLAEEVDVLVVRGVFAGERVGVVAAPARAREDSGVVLVGGEDAVGVQRVGVLDHLEQRAVAWRAVDGPRGVENFVAAVFGVGLREHHQLDVVRVALQRGEGVHEVSDLVSGESEAERAVGLLERDPTAGKERDARHRPRLLVAEKRGAGGEVSVDDLRHSVEKLRAES